jgi:cell division septum initiation protein DivIVA
MNELTDSLEQFLKHERQESDTLAELATALEAHRIAMSELGDALAQVRRELFGETAE